nr:immunoglobulin light chain junction region [Macaca mulatta]
CQQENSIPPSF